MSDIVKAIREGDAVHPDVAGPLADYVEALEELARPKPSKATEKALREALGLEEKS